MLNNAITTLVITHALCCSIDASMLMTERPHDTNNSLQANTLLQLVVRPFQLRSNSKQCNG